MVQPHVLSFNLICIADFPIGDEKDLSRHSWLWLVAINCLERVENLGASHVGLHALLQRKGLVERLLAVRPAAFGEEKLMIVAEGDDVEGASDGEGFEEEQEGFFGGVDSAAAHRPGSIHDKHKLGFLQFGA